MASEPKLYAVFGPLPAMKRVGNISNSEVMAWEHAGGVCGWDVKVAKENGYTCREVVIVPKDEVGK